jgi:hypothetical protein
MQAVLTRKRFGWVAGMYGFDIEAERRREAGFRDEIRRRWEARMAKKEEMANAEPVVAPPVISPLAALAFREAKTMPECPHEYVVRTPENEVGYVALFNLIVEQGVHESGAGVNISIGTRAMAGSIGA